MAPPEPDGGGEVDGPYPHGDRFAVRFVLDGVAKMSLYTVRDGLIVGEDVYYPAPPAAVATQAPMTAPPGRYEGSVMAVLIRVCACGA